MAESEYEKAYRRAEDVKRVLDALPYLQVRTSLRKELFPRFLFKFRQLETTTDVKRLGSIVLGSELWLSSPQQFNDPFDMEAKFVSHGTTARQRRERFTQILKDRRATSSVIQRELPKLMARTDEQNATNARNTCRSVVNQCGVCSFGGDPRNILMWSHYAGHHSGVCLVFEIARDPRSFAIAERVDYSTEYPVINWVTGIRGQVSKIILHKHIGWKYEDERRIVLLEQANQPLRFRPNALRAIIMGCNIKAETAKDLRGLLTERALLELPKIYLYKCVKHESEYRLRIFRSKAET